MNNPSMVTDEVSIIVVNYNAGHLLERCIGSCLQQAGEVILVDNASMDDSLNTLSHRFGEDSRLQIIRNSANLGFAAACNIGANVARGEFLLFLNPDCELRPDAVHHIRQALTADPKAGMAGGLLLDNKGAEQAGGRRAVPTPWRSLVRALHLSRYAGRWPRLFENYNLHEQPLPDAPIEVEAISGACTMVKSSVMRDVGPWDESYFLHCEDLDICMRFRQKGWRILFVPDSHIVHHRGVCSHSRPIFVEWHKHRGMMRFYRKFFRHQYPGALLWLVSLAVWTRFCAIAVFKHAENLNRTVQRVQ